MAQKMIAAKRWLAGKMGTERERRMRLPPLCRRQNGSNSAPMASLPMANGGIGAPMANGFHNLPMANGGNGTPLSTTFATL